MILLGVCHNSRKRICDIIIILGITELKGFMKGCRRGGIRNFEEIRRTMNRKLTDESQNDQCKKYSVFDDLQDGSK